MFDLSTIKAKNRQAAAKFKKPLHSQPLCSSPDVKIRECINDFIVTGLGPNGGLLVTPANKGAKSFLRKMFAFSEDYRGASVVIKHRNWPSILWLIQADGMTALRK